METYKASLDTTSKIITGFVFLMAIYGIVMWVYLDTPYVGLMLDIVVIPTILFTYLYSVKYYQITGDKLIIKRPISVLDKSIFLSDLESIQLLTKEDFKWTIRTFGNGGLFGYYGLYANPKLGSFRMYATNRASRIVIVLKDQQKKIVISPDDVGMLATLQRHLKVRV